MTSAGVLVSAETRDEAALEGLRIQRREGVAQMIVRGGAVHEGPEAAQTIMLLLAEYRDVGERLRLRQNPEQAKQQHFVERVENLAQLPAVRHLLEVRQKTVVSAKATKSPSCSTIEISPSSNQRTSTDSALKSFVTSIFTRLPWSSPQGGLCRLDCSSMFPEICLMRGINESG